MQKANALSRSDDRPVVSIIMPALNEEPYIEAAIRSILPKEDRVDCELIVVDGGSTDRTVEIVAGLCLIEPRLRLVHNDRRIQSAAINMGARIADPRSAYILRADCHSRYPAGFVEGCLDTLKREGVASVVVPMRTIGQSCMQRAIAAAQNSRVGNGGSRHRIEGRSGHVDHGHHAAFDRHVFLQAGGYDERFSHNEDAELDMRLVRAGHRIYLDANLGIDYFPRKTLRSLARQYHNFGWGRANTLLKHRAMPKLRQIAPVLLLAMIASAAAIAPFEPRVLAVPLAYALGMTALGAVQAARCGDRCLLMVGPAAIVMHLTWAAGFARRVVAGGFGLRVEPALPASASQKPS